MQLLYLLYQWFTIILERASNAKYTDAYWHILIQWYM